MPRVIDGGVSVWAQYVIEHENRDGLAAHLKVEGIPTAVYYPAPMHGQPPYAHFERGPGGLPVTDAAAGRVLALPMHPYLTEGEVDTTSLERLLSLQIEAGVDGLFVLGSSGEVGYLTDAQRAQVVQTAIGHVGGQVPVLVGVNDMTTNRVIAVAEQAREAGADAIVATAPFYAITDKGRAALKSSHQRPQARHNQHPKSMTENHIPDATKMIGETPRTDELEYDGIGISNFGHQDLYYAYKFARQLERELNAANERISKLYDYVAALETGGDLMAHELGFGYDVDLWNKARGEAKP